VSAVTGDQIASLRAEGNTVGHIAAELGVSTTTVYRWADREYLGRQYASQRRWKRRNRERVRAGRERYLGRVALRCSRCGRPLGSPAAGATRGLWRLSRGGDRGAPTDGEGALDAGVSPAAIAAQLSLPSRIVASDLHRLRERRELGPGRPNGFDPELDRELIALYQDGWPLPEIARSLGRHKRTITRRLARLRARGLVERRAGSPEPRPPAAPAGFAARAARPRPRL
jgi:transposase